MVQSYYTGVNSAFCEAAPARSRWSLFISWSRLAEPQHQPNAQILCVQESIDEGVGSSASQPAAMFNTSSPKQTTGKTPPVERRRQSRHDWHARGRQHVNGA